MLLEVIQPACLWPGEMTVTYGDLPHRSCLLSRHAPASPQYSISVSSVLRVTSSSSVPSVTQESRFFPGKAGASCKRTRKTKSHLRSESATLCQSTLRWCYSPVRVPCQRLSCSHLCAQELTMSCPRLKLKVQSSPPATAPLPW